MGRSREVIGYFSAMEDGVLPHLNASNSGARYPSRFKYSANVIGNRIPSFPKNTCLNDQVTNYPWLSLSQFLTVLSHTVNN